MSLIIVIRLHDYFRFFNVKLRGIHELKKKSLRFPIGFGFNLI